MSDCTCYPVPEEYWTTHYGAVDPATTMEPNYDCPVHFPDEALVQLLGELGIAEEDQVQFLLNVDKAARALTSDPQQELLFRLNARLRGDDPGKPVNWRGLQ